MAFPIAIIPGAANLSANPKPTIPAVTTPTPSAT